MSACKGSRGPAVKVHEFFLTGQRWGICTVCDRWVRLGRHDRVRGHKSRPTDDVAAQTAREEN